MGKFLSNCAKLKSMKIDLEYTIVQHRLRTSTNSKPQISKMSPNRRIFLNIIATYGRSLYKLRWLVCGAADSYDECQKWYNTKRFMGDKNRDSLYVRYLSAYPTMPKKRTGVVASRMCMS